MGVVSAEAALLCAQIRGWCLDWLGGRGQGSARVHVDITGRHCFSSNPWIALH